MPEYSKQMTFSQWKKNNPDIENLDTCPECHGNGWNEDDDELCSLCDGDGEINDLWTLYQKQLKKDRERLAWWLFEIPMFVPLFQPIRAR